MVDLLSFILYCFTLKEQYKNEMESRREIATQEHLAALDEAAREHGQQLDAELEKIERNLENLEKNIEKFNLLTI